MIFPREVLEWIGPGRDGGGEWTLEAGTNVVTTSGRLGTVSFPSPFSFAPNIVAFDGEPGSSSQYLFGIRSWDANGFTFHSALGFDGAIRVNWIAFGYRGD